jgi:hypothetical protein
MSVQDNKLLFGEDQAVTSVASNASTNVLDLGTGLDAWGSARIEHPGDTEKLWLNTLVTTAVTSSGSATVQFILQDSANASSFSAVYSSAAIAKASLVAGYNAFRMPLPTGLRRYIRVVYKVAVAALTAGKFTSWLGMDPADKVALKR